MKVIYVCISNVHLRVDYEDRTACTINTHLHQWCLVDLGCLYRYVLLKDPTKPMMRLYSRPEEEEEREEVNEANREEAEEE